MKTFAKGVMSGLFLLAFTHFDQQVSAACGVCETLQRIFEVCVFKQTFSSKPLMRRGHG